MLGIIERIIQAIPNLEPYFIKDIQSIKLPRFMVAEDIDHWSALYKQINPNTGRTNSYRDIRKICAAENRKVPALGTLRNYLGSGGVARRGEAVAEWRAWFEEFGRFSGYYEEEFKTWTTKEEWLAFREVYRSFMGY